MSLSQVGVEFYSTGEDAVERAYKRLANAQQSLDRGIKVSIDANAKQAGTLDRVTREALKVQRELLRLDAAVRRGAISQGQFVGEANRMAKRLRDLGLDRAQSEVSKYRAALDSARGATSVLNRATAESAAALATQAKQAHGATAAVTAQAAAVDRSAKGVNRYGLVMQQTGYQVGDFLVQVQSGTNAFVAFGQQATQMAGLLTLSVNPYVIALGAALSVLIPLGTAVAAAFMRTSEKTKDLGDAVRDAESALRDFTDVQSQLADDSVPRLVQQYGALANEARSILQIRRQLLEIEAALAQQTALQAMSKEFNTWFENFTGAADVATRYVEAIDRAAVLEGERAAIQKRAADAEAERKKLLEDVNGLTAEQTYTLFTQQDFTAQLFQKQQQINAEMETQQKLAGRVAEELGVSTRAANAFLVALADAAATKETEARAMALLRARDALYDAAKESGVMNDSLRAAILSLTDAELKALALAAAAEDTADNINRAASAAGALTGSLSAAASQAIAVRDNLVAAADAQRRLGQAAVSAAGLEAGSAAELAALKNGYSEVEAVVKGYIAQRRVELGVSDMIAEGLTLEAALAEQRILKEAENVRQKEASTAAAEAYRKEIEELTKTVQTGASSAASGGLFSLILPPEALAKLERAQALTAQYRKEVAMLDDALRAGLISWGEYNSYLDMARTEFEQLAPAITPIEQAMQQVSDSVGDALMSMVDGTKSASDAFKDMARIILRQAFELLVIKPIIDGLFGATGTGGLVGGLLLNANGNAFQNGVVQPFANGGVVSSPTTFPMAGNRTGLMGEAGPKATMPLKRTKSGKLGVAAENGQGNVTVNNHFHIAANGDESVKRIIAAEAPKIASLTQKQILESRARGGSFRATFG